MAKKGNGFEEIMRSVAAKDYRLVYGLMGDEPYFIDQITDYIERSVLNETEREFNQLLVYGADTSAVTIIEECLRYPMMSERRVIIVKEAQQLSDIDRFESYLKQPMPSTILVLAFKYGKIPKGVATLIDKNGVLFESKKIYDNQIPEWINRMLMKHQIAIDGKASVMLAEFLGADLTRLNHELDKLIIALSAKGERRITASLVEENVGISKEFNVFELVNAMLSRDVVKSNQIVNYFEKNSKKYPLVMTIGILFNTFSQLVIACSSKDRTQDGLMALLELKSSFQMKTINLGLTNYTPLKIVQTISLIRRYDAYSKGMYGNNRGDGELLRELVYKIMH